MTEKTVLLSRIEQIMRLGKTPAPYNALGRAEIEKLIDSTFAKYKDIEKPVLRIGSGGDPEVLVNASRKKNHVAPSWTKLASHVAKNEPLISEHWFKTIHDPTKEIPLRGGRKTASSFEDLKRKADVDRAVKNFASVLEQALANKDVFSPDRFTNKRQAQYEGQERGEGRHIKLPPFKEAPEDAKKEARERLKEQPFELTEPGEPDPHEHFLALHNAIASSLRPEDLQKITAKLGEPPHEKKLRTEYYKDFAKAKADIVDEYFKRYVDEDGEFTDDAPKEWKQAYNESRTGELAHREAANIAERESAGDTKNEAGKQIPPAPRPWYEQLKIDVEDINLSTGRYVTGIWEEKTDKGWKKHSIKGNRVYKVPGGDVIVQDLDGMRVRVFAPSKDTVTGRVNSNLAKPRIFTNDKGVDTIVQAYCEQRVPIPDDYNPPRIKSRDWAVVSDIQNKLYAKAKEEAMLQPPKQRKKYLKAVEAKYKVWNMAKEHSGPEYNKLWSNWFRHVYLDSVSTKEDAKYNRIAKVLNMGGGPRGHGASYVSNNDMQFYFKIQDRIKKLRKATRADFNVAYEQRVMAANSQGFSPLESPDVNVPVTDSKKLAEDALNYEINKKVRATKAGKEYAKWRDLAAVSYARIEAYKESPNLTEPQEAQEAVPATDKTPAIPAKPAVVGSPYYKKKKEAPKGFEEEAAEAADYEDEEEEDIKKPVSVDAEGNLVDRGLEEVDEEAFEDLLNKPQDAEDIEDEKGHMLDDEDEEEKVIEPEQRKDDGVRGVEEMRLEWLNIRAKRAATQSNIEYAKAKAAITGKIIKISGLYSEDNTSIYDFVATSQGQSHIINKRGMSPSDMQKGFYALDKDTEAFFTSPKFDNLFRGEVLRPEEAGKLLAGQKVLAENAWYRTLDHQIMIAESSGLINEAQGKLLANKIEEMTSSKEGVQIKGQELSDIIDDMLTEVRNFQRAAVKHNLFKPSEIQNKAFNEAYYTTQKLIQSPDYIRLAELKHMDMSKLKPKKRKALEEEKLSLLQGLRTKQYKMREGVLNNKTPIPNDLFSLPWRTLALPKEDWKQGEQVIGEQPPFDSPERGSATLTPHYDWNTRLIGAINRAVRNGNKTKDFTDLDKLYVAFPEETRRFRHTKDPRDFTPDEIAEAERKIAEENRKTDKLKITVPQEYSLRSPDLSEGESKEDYNLKKLKWEKDLLKRYDKASSDEKNEMVNQYKHVVAAKPNEQHPFDSIPEVKQVRDTLMTEKNAGEVKREVDDVLANINDNALRTAIRRDINDKNKKLKQEIDKYKATHPNSSIKEVAHTSEYVPANELNTEIDRRRDEIKERALASLESKFNGTINREDYSFVPNEITQKVKKPTKQPVTEKAPIKEKPISTKEPTMEDVMNVGNKTTVKTPKEIGKKIKDLEEKPTRQSATLDKLDALLGNMKVGTPKEPKIATPKEKPVSIPKQSQTLDALDALLGNMKVGNSTPKTVSKPKLKTPPIPKQSKTLDYLDSILGAM